jgi:hypothetical protein
MQDSRAVLIEHRNLGGTAMPKQRRRGEAQRMTTAAFSGAPASDPTDQTFVRQSSITLCPTQSPQSIREFFGGKGRLRLLGRAPVATAGDQKTTSSDALLV